jgi:hypothetical protein
MTSLAVSRPIAIAALLGAALPGVAAAQQFETLGARALGMGGAFVAVADDATAIYWNPAGLATGAFVSLLVDRQTAEVRPADGTAASGRSATMAALSLPQIGVSYQRLRHATAVLSSDETAAGQHGGLDAVRLVSLISHETGLTLLQSLADGIVVATTLKVVRGIAAEAPGAPGQTPADLLDEAVALVGRASTAVDLDVGLMAGGPRARAGLVIRNVRQPEFALPAAGALRLERQIRAGVAWLPHRRLTLAADLDLATVETPHGPRRNVAAGAEAPAGRNVVVRGGLRLSTTGDRRPAAAAGLSIAARPGIWIDGQLTRGQADADSGWGLAARVGF